MKIAVVIQSDDFRTSAGMRIRYDRFSQHLGGADASIETLTVADLASAGSFHHDAYVFCKTFDTAALLLARRLHAAGKAVGQDVFDDYFSQHGDQRLDRFRQWLRDMAPVTDFAVCTTERMIDVLKPYLPGVPITAIEDPVSDFDPAAVDKLADVKVRKAQQSREIDLAWFGIGDNPYFPVGLSDLAACEPHLAVLERLGWTIRLRVVTNRRPFEAGGAEALRRLSVGYELIEWSEDAERAVLQQSTVALLPVSGQSFSRAKSMNRAVTALGNGCQVLSLGYPLYQALDDFIYRSVEQLAADLENRSVRLSGSSVADLAVRLSSIADPSKAAHAFVGAAEAAARKARPARAGGRLLCLLHGRNTNIAFHKAVGVQGGLSVRTPFTKGDWNFPVRFDRLGRHVAMRVTPQIATKYALPLTQPDQVKRVLELDFVQVDSKALGAGELLVDMPDRADAIQELAIYEDVMRFASECCEAAFSGCEILISDTSPLARRPAKRLPSRQRKVWSKTAAGGSKVKRRRPNPLSAIVGSGARKAAIQRDASTVAATQLFDPAWYLRRYPDIARSGIDPARHYVEFGWREGRDPGPSFSTRKYLALNEDVASSGTNPLVHFVEFGEAEGRVAPAADLPRK